MQLYELLIVFFGQAFAGEVDSGKNETNFRSCVYDKLGVSQKPFLV